MNLKLFASVILASTALAPVWASPARAAAGEQPAQPVQDPQTTSNAPADIVVTARRTEERLQDVPISIAVFNQETLDNRNITTADDLARQTPSLSSNSRFGNQSSSFAIRGFTQETQTSPSVAVYFADVVAPRAQGSQGGGNGAGVGQFFDLQSAQVLRGPQGTLFGRNTTGGAVLLVPQRPTDRFEGYLEGSVGNYDLWRLQGVVNIPLGDQAALRIGVDHQERDGYLRNRSGIGPEDFNDINYTSIRASLLVDLTPELENYTIVRYSRSDTNGPMPRVIATNTLANCQPRTDLGTVVGVVGPLVCSQQLARQNNRGDGFYDVESDLPYAQLLIENWSVINTTTFRLSDTLTLRNIASYQEFTQNGSGNGFGTNIVIPATINLSAISTRIPAALTSAIPTGAFAGRSFSYVSTSQDFGRDVIQQWTASEEVQLQGRTADNRLTFQLGAYYEHSGPLGDYQGSRSPVLLSCTDVRINQCTDVIGALFSNVLRSIGSLPPGAPNTSIGTVANSLTRYEFENIGFYGQATFNITDQLSVTGGLRYTIDTVDADGASRTFRFFTPNVPDIVCSGNAAVSGALISNCSTDILFPGRGNQRSEKPTWLVGIDYHVTDDILLYGKYSRGYRQGSVNVSSALPVSWAPESVDAYELGAKLTFSGPISGFFNVAAFYNDLTGQQLPASLVPNGTVPGLPPAQAIVNAGQSRIQGIEIDAAITPFRGFTLSVGYAYLDTELISYTVPTGIPGYTVTGAGAVGFPLTYAPENKVTATARYTLPLPETWGQLTVGATFTHTDSQASFYDVRNGNAFSNPFQIIPATDLLDLNLNWNSVAGSNFDLALFATNVTDEEYNVAIGNGYNTAGYEYAIRGQPQMYGARLRYRFGG